MLSKKNGEMQPDEMQFGEMPYTRQKDCNLVEYIYITSRIYTYMDT